MSSSDQKFHSVRLDRDKCCGCTNCVKRCPTEAIRVRDGKARIIEDRCIDCGECIRVCKQHAKLPVVDQLSQLEAYKYKIALPAPALFGQFNNLESVSTVLYGLLKMGFDDIFEVARAAECVSTYTRSEQFFDTLTKPIISSACPAVVRLIRVRYPELLENVLALNSPMEVAARAARAEAMQQHGLRSEDIGICFISPCAAKMTATKSPLGTDYSAVDLVVGIRDVYPLLIQAMSKQDDAELYSQAGRIGLSWGSSGGEAAALLRNNYLAADGIENVINVLDNLEDEKLAGLDFVELNACCGGCTGGVLTVANPYMSNTNLKSLTQYMPVMGHAVLQCPDEVIRYDKELTHLPVLQLNSDRRTAHAMMQQLRDIEAHLYGMDCGACGAPSCKALAEDIVRGFATEEFCMYKMKDRVRSAAQKLSELSEMFPQLKETGEWEG